MVINRSTFDAVKTIGLQPRELFETVHTSASSLRLHEKLSARDAAVEAIKLAEECMAVTLEAFQITVPQEPLGPPPPKPEGESYRMEGARLVRSAISRDKQL